MEQEIHRVVGIGIPISIKIRRLIHRVTLREHHIEENVHRIVCGNPLYPIYVTGGVGGAFVAAFVADKILGIIIYVILRSLASFPAGITDGIAGRIYIVPSGSEKGIVAAASYRNACLVTFRSFILNIGKSVAIAKGIIADSRHAMGDGDRGKTAAPVKGT